jgi:hypothetical protein
MSNKVTIALSNAEGDWADNFNVVTDYTELGWATLLRLLEKRDAENAGMPVEDCAGYDLVSFMPNERAALIRTTGLGPKPEQNVLMLVGWTFTK